MDEKKIPRSEKELFLEQVDSFREKQETSPDLFYPLEKTLIHDSSLLATQSVSIKIPPIESSILSMEERYEVLKTLGEGGMGVVQLVKDHLLGREVALKTIKLAQNHVSHLSDKQKMMLWRLNKEASIMAILEHPNIVPLYEIQEREGELCFTMRKVEGSTLRDIFKAKQEGDKSYDENKLLGIFLKVCEAVSYAHSKGIIHRDLKPENIMVGPFREVYVMDWGIAKKLHDTKIPFSEEEIHKISENNSFEEMKTIGGIGTLGYMSPEQRNDAASVNPQADIYSLGIILKECFTLLSPIESFKKEMEEETRKRTVASLRQKKEVSLEKKLPEEILAIIEKATKNNWQKRYEEVAELYQDIESYQKYLYVSVKKYSSLESFRKWIKRYKQQIRMITTVVTCLLITFFFYNKWKDLRKTKQHLKNAHLKITQAKMIKSQSKQALSQKIENLLQALIFLNSALMIQPKSQELEQLKWDVGQQLIQLCYTTNDYNLATFVANDMQKLIYYSEENKSLILAEVVSKQDKTTNEHKEKFQKLKEKFWNKSFEYALGEKENAIFEIAKMPEKEIFEALVQILKEGTHYFLSEKTNYEEKQTEFYMMMVTSLGRLENPDAGPHLMQAIELINDYLSSLPNEMLQKEETKMNYLVLLAEALANSKDYEQTKKFDEIRTHMGVDSVFWSRTHVIFQRLLKDLHTFDEKIQSNPQDAFAYMDRGRVQLEKGDIQQAIQDYSQAIRLNPQLWGAYNNRGNAKLSLNDFEGAIQDYNHAIDLNPQFTGSYSNRGNAKKALGLLKEAIQDYSFAISLNPKDTASYYNRGNTKHANQDPEGAIQDYSEAIRLNPQFTAAYHHRGLVQKSKNNFEAALQDYNTAIRLNPQLAEAYSDRGVLKKVNGDLNGAFSDYSEAIRLNPKLADAYNNRGSIKFARGDLEDAFQDYNEAIRLNPQGATFYNNRGSLQVVKEDLDKALLDYNEAIRLNPKYHEALATRGSIFFKQGKEEEAKADFQQYLKITKKMKQPQIQKMKQTIFQFFPELTQRD